MSRYISAVLTKLFRYLPLVLLLTAIWIVLNERLTVATVAFGVAMSVIAIVATNRLVLRESYLERYTVRPLALLRYVAQLVWAIYIAGFQAIIKMLQGRVHVGIVDIKTRLEDEFAVTLLANSITLTPGTVTVDRDGQNLKVVWIDCTTHDPEIAGPAVKGPFEDLLEKVVR